MTPVAHKSTAFVAIAGREVTVHRLDGFATAIVVNTNCAGQAAQRGTGVVRVYAVVGGIRAVVATSTIANEFAEQSIVARLGAEAFEVTYQAAVAPAPAIPFTIASLSYGREPGGGQGSGPYPPAYGRPLTGIVNALATGTAAYLINASAADVAVQLKNGTFDGEEKTFTIDVGSTGLHQFTAQTTGGGIVSQQSNGAAAPNYVQPAAVGGTTITLRWSTARGLWYTE